MPISIDQLAPAARKQAMEQLAQPTKAVEADVAVFDSVVSEGKEVKELHEPFMQFLKARDIFYHHAKAHKRSSLPVGWPDFEILLPHGKVLFVEFKTPKGLTSKSQLDRIERLVELGFQVLVTRSLHKATAAVESQLSSPLSA